jgi:hypothetical protein
VYFFGAIDNLPPRTLVLGGNAIRSTTRLTNFSVD